MSNSDFVKARNLFEDENKRFESYASDYILLESLTKAYTKLLDASSKPLKMVLLYGSPGSGKTAILNRLCTNLTNKNHIILPYMTPTFANETELIKIFNANSDEKLPLNATFYEIVKNFTDKFNKDEFLIILDEAQLYSEHEMELIRLLSDTRVFKFIVALHSIENEEQIAKAHFQTRIWETIELKPIAKDEVKVFCEKKLLAANLGYLTSSFSDRHYALIQKFTNGNLRDIMKFFYSFFDFCEFLDRNHPTQIDIRKFTTKHVEMVAIHCGFIDIA